MEASILSRPLAAAPARTSSTSIPWYCHAMLIAATSIIGGLIWDISWHTTIGRDTFWTPAHLAIYLGGVLAGVSCGFLVLKTTLAGTAEERAASVRVWGMRGPLGAWFAIWGAFAMITSAPFDDWWHNAYGLDVKILSPPHVVLALGMMGVVYGAVLFLLARQNRGEAGERWFRLSYVYCAGIGVAMLAILVTEYSLPNDQHSAMFYLISCGLFPFALASLGRGSRLRWPATSVAACYMGVMLVTAWVLELFPATPKLAPIYNPVDHMVPLGFPLLLVVPAFAIDLVAKRMLDRNDWLAAAVMAAAFVVTFFATQWFFSEFLLGAAADNAFFMGNRTWSYGDRLGSWTHEYWDTDVTALTPAICLALAFVSTRLGLSRGRWMREVVR